ncbi:MAG TPA: hypothetical protein VF680_17310 [Allosphingosinicella sp.]|jgi:hypothetical protein
MHQVAWRFYVALPLLPSHTVTAPKTPRSDLGDADTPTPVITQLHALLAEHNSKSILPAVGIRLGYGVRFALECEMLANACTISSIDGKDGVVGLPITYTIKDCPNAVEFY